MFNRFMIVVFIVLCSCKDADINDKDRRNENWTYWVDAETGKATWKEEGHDPPQGSGTYTAFYSTGGVFELGRLRNGKHVDTIFHLDLEQKLMSYMVITATDTITHYVNNGPLVRYWPDLQIMSDGVVENHTEGVPWIRYYRDGTVNYEKVKDKDLVKTATYYPSGQIEGRFGHLHGKQEGRFQFWYPNGQVKEICDWKNGMQHGIYLYYHDNGKLARRSTLTEGKAEGIVESWHQNGQRGFVFPTKADLKHGTCQQWFPNGNKHLVEEFVHGKKHGKFTGYHENGRIQSVGMYENDAEAGIWKFYDEAGVLTEETDFSDVGEAQGY